MRSSQAAGPEEQSSEVVKLDEDAAWRCRGWRRATSGGRLGRCKMDNSGEARRQVVALGFSHSSDTTATWVRRSARYARTMPSSPSGLSRRRQNTTSRNPSCFTPKITWNMGSLISVQSSQIKGTWAIFSMKKEWKKSPETRPWGHGVMLGKVDLQLRLADEERGCCLTNFDRSYG